MKKSAFIILISFSLFACKNNLKEAKVTLLPKGNLKNMKTGLTFTVTNPEALKFIDEKFNETDTACKASGETKLDVNRTLVLTYENGDTKKINMSTFSYQEEGKEPKQTCNCMNELLRTISVESIESKLP